MSKSKSLYIDSNYVTRGYYVYMHKERVTGVVFYVGKGHGRRAWEEARRNSGWKQHVVSLPGGWDVEIVRDDLSEIEAFELEATLVEQYGDCGARGGTLKNWIPGGENPESVVISIQFDDNGWSAAYQDARTFKNLPRQEQEAIASSAIDALEPISEMLFDLDEVADAREDHALGDSVSTVESVVNGILDASKEFKGRRISWKDFGMAMEEGVDDLELELLNVEAHHPKVRHLLGRASQLTRRMFVALDSGNREEAEDIANCKASEK